MQIWLIWMTICLLALAALTAVLLIRSRLASMKNRLALVERQLDLARVREERENEKLDEIFRALASLKSTLEILLDRVHEKLEILTTPKSR